MQQTKSMFGWKSVVLLGVLAISAPNTAASAKDFANPFELRELAVAGEFDALEKRIAEAWTRYEAGEISEKTADSHLQAFATSDPTLAEPLDSWVASKPDSWVALAARGLYRFHSGGLYRGEAIAGRTSKERFRRMHQSFAHARPDLKAALSRKARLGIAYATLIHMAKAEGQREAVDNLLAVALKADPLSLTVRSAYLDSLQPQWDGSQEAMWRFVKESQRWIEQNQDLEYLEIQYRERVARNLFRNGRNRATIRTYSDILEDRETATLYMIRGETYLRLRKLDAALADFQRARELSPYWPPPLAGAAWIKATLHRNDEALADLNLAVRIDPLAPRYLRARASELERQYRFGEAVTDLTDALVFGWDDPRLWFRRGNLFADALRDNRRAIPDYQKAIELAPRDARNRWHLGLSFSKLGKCDAIEAWRGYKSLCDHDPRCSKREYPRMQRLTEELINKRGCSPGKD